MDADPNASILTRATRSIARAFRRVGAIAASPFTWAGRWYIQRGWILQLIFGAIVIVVVGLYGYFFWNTQRWAGFDPDYVAGLNLEPAVGAAQTQTTGGVVSEETPQPQTCRRSAIVDVTADLVDFNVNRNAWISSMVLYKLGFFGLDWDRTPFFDNKASFQRGVNQAVRRTSVELVDTLGRVRGTSQVDQDLQDARGNLQFDEYSWYFGLHPFGPKTPTPGYYRAAIKQLQAFNDRLSQCQAVFDARADNLLQFIDRVANDIGATSAILRDRSEQYNSGWFDTRADDRFWFAYGQLYGYYGILSAAGADFRGVIDQRDLGQLWSTLEDQLRAALRIQPFIISNGAESGWLMPSHLATMGFYVLRVRSNLIEVRLVLDR